MGTAACMHVVMLELDMWMHDVNNGIHIRGQLILPTYGISPVPFGTFILFVFADVFSTNLADA